jgi:hypothetical protein
MWVSGNRLNHPVGLTMHAMPQLGGIIFLSTTARNRLSWQTGIAGTTFRFSAAGI